MTSPLAEEASIYEINTGVWLDKLPLRLGRQVA